MNIKPQPTMPLDNQQQPTASEGDRLLVEENTLLQKQVEVMKQETEMLRQQLQVMQEQEAMKKEQVYRHYQVGLLSRIADALESLSKRTKESNIINIHAN